MGNKFCKNCEEKLSTLKTELSTLRKELGERGTELSNLRTELGEREAQLGKYMAEVDELEINLTELKKSKKQSGGKRRKTRKIRR